MTEKLSLFEPIDTKRNITACSRSQRKTCSKQRPQQLQLFPESTEIWWWHGRSSSATDFGRRTLRVPRRYAKGQLVAVGRKNIPIGEDASQAKFLDSDVAQVFALREEGYSFSQIAGIMDMGKSTVWAIVHGHIRGQFPADYRRIHEKRKKK